MICNGVSVFVIPYLKFYVAIQIYQISK